VPSARVIDIAAVLIGDRPIQVIVSGIRPGEKIHEILVSEEEVSRCVEREGYFVIMPLFPEVRRSTTADNSIEREFSSADRVMTRAELAVLLRRCGLRAKTGSSSQESWCREDHDGAWDAPGDYPVEPDYQEAGSPV
jgi:FlaA1/EpsC-like NDP-sugar epimerase